MEISDKDILEKSFCAYEELIHKYVMAHTQDDESISLNTHEILKLINRLERVCFLLDQFFTENREGDYELCVMRRKTIPEEVQE